MTGKQTNLMRDMGVVALSIILAVILAKTGVLKDILSSVGEMKIVGSFLAGIFFVSIFTVAPAAVVLVEIAQANSLIQVAIFGALGAMVGDLLIFRFIRDSLSRSLMDVFIRPRQNKIALFFRKKIFRVFGPLIGAIIIASPFPDEIGLIIMGVSGLKSVYFIPLAFSLNFLGILALGALGS